MYEIYSVGLSKSQWCVFIKSYSVLDVSKLYEVFM